MSKKYLSLEEAAQKIGLNPGELNRLREKGTIRAFADRGTWKFKEEDVEKLARSRQTDSDPDVPLQLGTAEEDSSAELVFSDEDALGAQPTIISKNPLEDSGSDSDVRLIFDESMSVPESKSSPEDSDSDVKLAGVTPAGTTKGGRSDSDVKLLDEPTTSGSDSDVRLVSSDSSSEVQLSSGSGISLAEDSATYPGRKKEDSSTVNLAPAGEDESVLDDESGISLAEGSGIALASDSGISLERPNDSGISLSEESSIVLAEDSGISLAPEGPVTRRGGRKGPKSPADSDDLTGTIPLLDVPLAAESDDILDTQMEVPMLGDSSEESSFAGGRGDSTSVITLDEDEDEYVVAGDKSDSEEDVFAVGSSAEVDVEEVDEEEVDVSDEIVGEDDELGEDVFGAEDEDFAEEIESGESVSELPIAPRGMAAPVEQEWGTGVFAGLALSTFLMVACGTVLYDMVRNTWYTNVEHQNPIGSMLLDMFKGM